MQRLPLLPMRYLIVTLLAMAMLGQAFVRTAWVLHYQWNRAQYLEKCENKFKPSMHCNGKCQLRKRLIATHESQDPAAPRLPERFFQQSDLQLFVEPLPEFPAFCIEEIAPAPLPLYAFTLPSVALGQVFHPPSQV